MKTNDTLKGYEDVPEAPCYNFVSSVYQSDLFVCSFPSLDAASILSAADMSLGS